MGKIAWTDENSRTLVNILNEEKLRGVSKFTWGNIAKIFNVQKAYDVSGKQVQNHYSDLKERYKCWEELQGLTGIAFNPTTKEVDGDERSLERYNGFLERNKKYGAMVIRQGLANLDEMIKLFDGKIAHGVGGCFSPAMGKGSSYLTRHVEDLTLDEASKDIEMSSDELNEFQDTMLGDDDKYPPSSLDRKVSIRTSGKRKFEESISSQERKRRETSFDSVIALLSGIGSGSSSKPSKAQMVSEELTRMKVAEESGDAYFVSAVRYLSDETRADIFLALQTDNQKRIYLRVMDVDPLFTRLY